MPDNRRLLDIWIVETNTAYRSVPFETVANWLQQGRLLSEDRVRPAGTKDWFRVDKVRGLVPYLPRAEPNRIDDKAEALEPVEGELAWRHPGDEEEDDPDMIPLIDITLVLLIFFMMTAAVQSGMFGPIDTPSAQYQVASIKEGTFIVGIDKNAKGDTRYVLGRDDKVLAPAPEEKKDFTMPDVLAYLNAELGKLKGEVRVSIRADRQLPVETIKSATLDLQTLEAQINLNRAVNDRVKLVVVGEVRTEVK